MQVYSVNNTPVFEARLKIKKSGFENIVADTAESLSISENSGKILVSSLGESTVFPLEIVAGKGFANSIKNNLNKLGENFKNIFHRNIKTVELENTENLKALSKESASAGVGSSAVSSGVASYAGSAGSALDQSVYYPVSVYDRSVPEYLNANAPESVNRVLGNLTNSAYDWLYNERGAGNESASSFSTIFSGVGASSQGIGSAHILDSFKKSQNIISKKIPS